MKWKIECIFCLSLTISMAFWRIAVFLERCQIYEYFARLHTIPDFYLLVAPGSPKQ